MLNSAGRLMSAVIALSLFVGVVPESRAAGMLGDRNLVNDLVYNTASGRVTIDGQDLTGTGPIVEFVLATDQSFDLTDGLVNTGLDCGLILPAVVCGDLNRISYSDVTNTGFEGMLDLGRILPSGLSGTEVQSFLTLAQYKSINVDTYVEFDLRIVPEASGALWLVVAGGALRLRFAHVRRSR